MKRVPEMKAHNQNVKFLAQVSDVNGGDDEDDFDLVFSVHDPLVEEKMDRFYGGGSPGFDSLATTGAWKGEHSLSDDEEFVPQVVAYKGTDDSFDDPGSRSFHGVSHHLEPFDLDLMRPVYVPPIGQKITSAGCLMKNLSVKGPSLEFGLLQRNQV